MAKAPNITADELRAILDYDPETGEFRWKTRTPDMFHSKGRPAKTNCNAWNGRYSGAVAGYAAPDGYVHVAVNDRLYKAHRLAWLWMTGEWPESEIDHKNMVRSDNRFANLRDANKAQNRMNQRVRQDSGTGIKGVRFVNSTGNFEARIKINRIAMYLGSFSSVKEASEAYAAAAKLHFGEFARTE